MGSIGEAGSFQTDGSGANPPEFTITLTDPLTNPVFAFTGTQFGGDPYTLRLVGQTVDGDGNTTSFTVRLEEWEYLDGAHPAIETISWLAIEEGTHTLADGRVIEAGTTPVTSTGQNTGTSVNLSAGFTDPPVVLTSVMTTNDAAAVDSDPSNITAAGFDLTLQEQEANDGIHGTETIGWIAIQGGGTAATGTASTSGNSVTDATSTLGLGDTFTNGVVLLETQTLDGPDTASAMNEGQTASTVDASVTEEQSANTETAHTTEVIGVVAFENGVIPCFLKGTRIAVPGGQAKVEDLAVGDLVLNRAGQSRAIAWISRRAYDRAAGDVAPRENPVRIAKGALGAGVPRRDLWVSQQHRVLVRSRIAARMFGSAEVLVAAKRLVGAPGVDIDRSLRNIAYYHILLTSHDLVLAEEMPVETLYLGPGILATLDARATAEVLQVVPDLRDPGFHFPPALPFAEGKRAKQLIARHLDKGRPFLSEEVPV